MFPSKKLLTLLDGAGGPGPGAADVGDEVGDLLGGGVVRGDGQHRVLAGYGAYDLQAFHPVEHAGDGPGGPVAGVDDHLILGRSDAEDEARQDLDAGGARLVRQRQVAVADLQRAELALGDNPEYEFLPRRLVYRCACRSQSSSPPTT